MVELKTFATTLGTELNKTTKDFNDKCGNATATTADALSQLSSSAVGQAAANAIAGAVASICQTGKALIDDLNTRAKKISDPAFMSACTTVVS